MKSVLALAIALALGAVGTASAGMQGQGATPKAKGETAEPGKEKAAPTGEAEQRGAAAREPTAREKKAGKPKK